ncbi:metalloprotease [Paenibacillus thalictri]|uniref:Site-2 protease family protein n=1 Tax=Paenibacillus thalictri TaxID=2527873 RepID=A0A4Q9DKQ4_9BACL|nr:site-2 protease family protein [Paenibacillus thalictri]TBL71431.1 site-2 protease family protein [Paenibacillus thalictri]
MRQQSTGKKKNPLWLFGAAGAFVLAKAKALLPLLKLGKAGGAVLSMLVTVGAYAILFPFGFAVGFVLLILGHELGHVIAAKRKGLPVSGIFFIPFLGALTNMKRNPRDAVTEAYIAFGGPLVGSMCALAVFAAALVWNHPLLYSLAYVGFFLNLINMLPINPLDGGRIVVAVSRWMWVVGLVGGLVVIYFMPNIILIIIWLMFAWDMYKKFVKYRNHGQPRAVVMPIQVEAQPLIDQGYFIPGPEHKRQLDFTTYCDLEDGRQDVLIYWENMQLEGRLTLPEQGTIKRVHVIKIDHLQHENGLRLTVHCQVDYEKYEDDAYYDVPIASRWKFGISYALLAVFLVYMMHLTHKAVGISA